MSPEERADQVYIVVDFSESVPPIPKVNYEQTKKHIAKAIREAVEEERQRHGVEPLSIEDIRKAVAEEREAHADLLDAAKMVDAWWKNVMQTQVLGQPMAIIMIQQALEKRK